MKLLRILTDHPASLGESYWQHHRVAMSYAIPLAGAAFAAALHAFLPFLFKTTASSTIRELNQRIAKRCGACPSGRRHRPDLFVERDAAVPTKVELA